VLAAPGCGAALPSCAADPVPDSGCPSPPIRALILMLLAAGSVILRCSSCRASSESNAASLSFAVPRKLRQRVLYGGSFVMVNSFP